mmetsp:Transcript_30966/g.66619  ORF Transcript_30966/g.66619 Transcript_30966/m.66619 type:complete len:229 (-) Transcript_30966:739-1425(-)
MTCVTSGTSNPRAATSVATSTARPELGALRKLCIAMVRAACDMPPSRGYARIPSLVSILASSFASFLKRTKSNTFDCFGNSPKSISRRRLPRAALGNTSTCWVIVLGTPETRTKRLLSFKATAFARASVAADQVAEKSEVLRAGLVRPAMARMSLSKPSSRRRSASSRTKRSTCRSRMAGSGRSAACCASDFRERAVEDHFPQSASSLPGVATNSAGQSCSNDSRCWT